MKKILGATFTVLCLSLLGAGCLVGKEEPAPSPSMAGTQTKPNGTNGTNKTNGTNEANTTIMVTTTALVAIDETWKTYTSRDGAFSFQYPTKGKFAPRWEQAFVPVEQVPSSDQCRMINLGEQQACQTVNTDGSTRTDEVFIPYSTQSSVRLKFMKTGVQDETSYQAQIEQIVGTFARK